MLLAKQTKKWTTVRNVSRWNEHLWATLTKRLSLVRNNDLLLHYRLEWVFCGSLKQTNLQFFPVVSKLVRYHPSKLSISKTKQWTKSGSVVAKQVQQTSRHSWFLWSSHTATNSNSYWIFTSSKHVSTTIY